MIDPDLLNPGEKVAVPKAWSAGMAKEGERRAVIDEFRQQLSRKQQEALDANPLGHFKTRISVEEIKSLSEDEREELRIFEESEYRRFKPLAQAKAEQRRAYVMAGGTAEDFERAWASYGRDLHISQVANETLERAAQSSSTHF